MGIGFIIAEVAGAMSTQLVRDRDRIELLHNTSRSLAASLGVARVLEAVAKSACDALGGRFGLVYEANDEPYNSA